ncbi:MAG TPA: protein-methionine-sulfoxide reductase catalytic subunit MsrP [Verrucomicrobiae bacterium]|nr:protein-methionine-sulfoxide reductase catalytic subunit MsrP [Verrucomicrobiae bacterium]
MANVVTRPGWWISENSVTPESVFRNRRQFLKELGFLGGATLMARALEAAEAKKGYPYTRTKEYEVPNLKMSDENEAATWNNFYEFSTGKRQVHTLTGKFTIDPWKIEVGGLCEKPMAIDVKELIETMPMEERVYRFRCVEAWGMIVPWTGFELRKLIEKAQPKPEAKFVRFVTALKREEMPGVARLSEYPWPYTEGLRMDEAMHPLTLVATGIYGKPLPKQHGAPVRIVVPWKYGYKSIKSIVKIEFVATQPKTLWETLAPDEYPFESNVNPGVPHPRWSQATEWMLGDQNTRVRTKLYNGYGEWVGKLYKA